LSIKAKNKRRPLNILALVADIIATANAFRSALLKRERKAAIRLVTAYGHIWDRLAKEICKLNQQIAEARARGEVVNQFWLSRQQRYFDLLRQVDAEFTRFAGFADSVITKQQAAAVKSALNDSLALMQTAAESAGISATFNVLPVGAVENLVGALGNGSPLRSLLDQLPMSGRAIVSQGLIEGVALGQGPAQIARQIRAGLGGNLTRALTISRTETLRAHRVAALANYQANASLISGWRWVSSKSRRSCLNCLSRDGSIYPLTKPFPAHPRCRCAFAPVLIGADDPQVQTAAEWFEEQPNDIKLDMMGPKAFELYKAKKVTLKDFEGERFNPQWGATTYQRSVKEIQRSGKIAG
jgi:SPP1 gp7 family putative phage head morphogenesis protein